MRVLLSPQPHVFSLPSRHLLLSLLFSLFLSAYLPSVLRTQTLLQYPHQLHLLLLLQRDEMLFLLLKAHHQGKLLLLLLLRRGHDLPLLLYSQQHLWISKYSEAVR